MALTTPQFVELLNGGIETRSVEFKAGGSRSDPLLFAFVARAVLAMSNLALGGWVILGVKDDGMMVGLSSSDAQTWLENDELNAGLNAYADPFVQVEAQQIDHDSKTFVVLRVREFEDVPVLAMKDSPGKHNGKLVVRQGGCYVRPRHQPASVEAPTQTEMRELIDLAVDKALKRFLRRADTGGLLTTESDVDKFANEIRGFR